MSEPQYDSNGDPVNEAAREEAARKEDAVAQAATIAAAQREAAERHEAEHEPPRGSWRAKMRNYEPEFVTLKWDGEEWEIPAKVPNAFIESRMNGDARTLMESIIGSEGMQRLRIPVDIDFELLGEMALDLAEAADGVWDVPNRNRSARRSRGTTRR